MILGLKANYAERENMGRLTEGDLQRFDADDTKEELSMTCRNWQKNKEKRLSNHLSEAGSEI